MRILLLSSLLGCAATSGTAAPAGPPMQRVPRHCETGVVAEVLQAGVYTYVRYSTQDGGERWMATLKTEPEMGATAGFVRFGEQKDFRSARLDRRFDHLDFGYIGSCAEPEETP